MTIKSSDIEKAIVLMDKINQYASEQKEEINQPYRNFYAKMQKESFELWSCLKNELRMRSI